VKNSSVVFRAEETRIITLWSGYAKLMMKSVRELYWLTLWS
jgi:hypothetical protein